MGPPCHHGQLPIGYRLSVRNYPQGQSEYQAGEHPLPQYQIRYRHYGRTLEVLIKKAIEFPEGEEKQNLIALICNHMKKDYMAWNKDTVDDRKISDDLTELSDGKLQMTDSIVRLMAERIDQNYRPKVNNQNNRNNNRNNKRKY